MTPTGSFPYRLIACDMDGTLLDGDGRLPSGFAGVLDRLAGLGVVFAPASGRQLATLKEMFDGLGEDMSFIAENGTVVVTGGALTSTSPMPTDAVHDVIDAVAAAPLLSLVVCHPECATVLPAGPEVEAELAKYYHARREVPDVAAMHRAVRETEVIKLAIHSARDAETHALPVAREAAPGLRSVVSGPAWVDIMVPGANKGTALEQMAVAVGAEPSQTLAFGDYLNDYELLEAAGTAVAMENAHPDLKAIADRIAPPNTSAGVMVVLRELLDAAEPGA